MSSTKLVMSAQEALADATHSRLPPWARTALDAFRSDLLSTDDLFPCIFGVEALKKNNLRFVFLDHPDDEQSLHTLKEALVEYLNIYYGIGRLTSFVAIFKPEATVRSLDEYKQTFWRILQYLHDHDPAAWPADMPQDVNDSLWEFCFNQHSIFVVCNTPAHTQRRSRRSRSLIVTFQPRWVFEGLGHTPKGLKSQEAIRKRLSKYDAIAPYSALGAYGDPDNREWKQYFLPDSNDIELTECPFRH